MITAIIGRASSGAPGPSPLRAQATRCACGMPTGRRCRPRSPSSRACCPTSPATTSSAARAGGRHGPPQPRRRPRGRARRRRPRAGEHARKGRGEAAGLRRPRPPRAARRRAGELDLGAAAIDLHGAICRAGRAASSATPSTRPTSCRPSRSAPRPGPRPRRSTRRRRSCARCGQAPLVMKREIDGFIMNRLQGALLEEAFRLVADGVAGIEDIDIGLRDGLALRWSFMGPFETIDLNAPGGVRDYAERYQGIYANIFPSVQRRVDWTGPVMDGSSATGAEARPRQARRAAGLARPAPHGAAGPQAAGRDRHRRLGRIMASPQSHHLLRRDGRDPHALDVAAPARHARRDRRSGARRGRGRRRHRAPARPQPRDRPAGPDARGLRQVPAHGAASARTW